MAKEKELTVDAEELAKDPAVKIAVEAPKVEEFTVTAKEIYGEELPVEVLQSGIGVGFVSGFHKGASLGVAGEDDERADTIQSRSQK